MPRAALPKAIVAVGLAVIVMMAAMMAMTRFGVLLPQTRLLIEARTDGLKVGRFGRLKIEGLDGDLWRDFTVRKLTIRDEKGVWLEADNIHLVWRYEDLFRRRFHADRLDAQRVLVVRRPTLSAKGKDSGLPVSFEIVEGATRLEMEPAFSYRRGVYDLNLALDVERAGGRRGRLNAVSLLHAGDHLSLLFDLDKKRPLVLRADGVEASGGALAGALGLPADQPFLLAVQAAGKMSQGQFTALATSGSARPLEARGAWNPDGGQASGRLSLTASRLTAAYASRFGPEARFGLSGRKAQGALYDLHGHVAADNLRLDARGLGNLGERRLGPQGMRVDVGTPDLSRIVSQPAGGPTRMVGTLTGVPAKWRLAGALNAERLRLGAYGLGRLSGPVEITQDLKGIEVAAVLAGAGGQGGGWLAAMLGGTPQARLKAARLTDGRLLLRDLSLTAKGLKLEARGDRSLLGALNLKGRGEISNLAAARAGAAGGATVSWSATQAAAGRPWTLVLEAKGDKLATGYPELDRLLGSQPRFQGQANLQGGRLAVAKADLTGAAASLTTAGVREGDGALKFKLDWSAAGPFRAGPVEILGKARGTGALTGTLAAPRADLTAELEAIDLPRLPLKTGRLTLSFLRADDAWSGLLALTADSNFGPARAKTAFRFATGGVDLSDLLVDAGGLKASGALALRDNGPSSADLKLDVAPGAFIETGRIAGDVRITDGQGGARARLALRAENARIAGMPLFLRTVRLTADGPLDQLPYTIAGQGDAAQGGWRLDGRGVLAAQRPGYQLTLDGAGQLGGRALKTTETARFQFGAPIRTARLRLAAIDGGRIDLDGRFAGDATDVQARVTGLGLGLFDPDLAGQADANLTLQGRGPRLDGVLEANLAGARGKGSPAASGLDGSVRARLAGDTLTLRGDLRNSAGLTSKVDLTLPAESSAAPFRVALARQRPMQGVFSASGEVRPLWDLLIGGERSLSGQLRTQGTLGGSLAHPAISGQVAMQGGAFSDGVTGLALRDVTLAAAFAQSGIDVTAAQGTDGHGGTVSGSGRISLAPDGVSSFRLDLKQFRLIDNDQATASATGQASIARAANGKVTLTGDLVIDRADVAARLPTPSGVVAMEVVERNRPPELAAALAPVAKRGDGWALDIKLRGPRRVFLKGRGLDVELSLNAQVGGTSSAPTLSGAARIVRGDYDFAGKRFQFDTDSVVYLANKPENIRLDLTATRDDPSLTAIIRIRGTAAKPEVSFTSSPSLPNDEVLSQVLFGRSASQLSPLEAAQLASALSSMAGGGGFDVIGNLRTFARLDRLALGGGNQNGVTVSGGKYITDSVYIELTGGSRLGPSAQVEWRVRRNLAIISTIGGETTAGNQTQNKLAIRWRRNY